MGVFTEAELEYLAQQRVARLATASATGQPDVSAVTFGVDGDDLVSGGFDLTKTVRYRHLNENPRATIVVDDLASVDPWFPRGIKVRGPARIEGHDGSLQVRISAQTIWSWGLNRDAEKHFAGKIEKRTVG
jgi:pyridoxamine 5'-phosphate oxidase family protein